MILNTYTPSDESEATSFCFSNILKAKAISLNHNSCIANGEKGYRTILGTQGVKEGNFYYEATVLNPS